MEGTTINFFLSLTYILTYLNIAILTFKAKFILAYPLAPKSSMNRLHFERATKFFYIIEKKKLVALSLQMCGPNMHQASFRDRQKIYYHLCICTY